MKTFEQLKVGDYITFTKKGFNAFHRNKCYKIIEKLDYDIVIINEHDREQWITRTQFKTYFTSRNKKIGLI